MKKARATPRCHPLHPTTTLSAAHPTPWRRSAWCLREARQMCASLRPAPLAGWANKPGPRWLPCKQCRESSQGLLRMLPPFALPTQGKPHAPQHLGPPPAQPSEEPIGSLRPSMCKDLLSLSRLWRVCCVCTDSLRPDHARPTKSWDP